jgi:hypothetical protein
VDTLRISLKILSPLPLTKGEDGKMIFDLWRKYLPDLLPDKFGNWEPIDRPFDPQHIETALDAWRWPFLAVKKQPSVDVSVWMRKGAKQRLHSAWDFQMDTHAASQIELITFLKEASIALNADFGYIHLTTPSELERGRMNKTAHLVDKRTMRFFFSVYSKDLQERIPDLLWATVFGAPYCEMFGRKCLLSAPAYIAQPLSDEMVLLQITEKLSDVEQRADAFNKIRSQVKAHLGEEAFFRPEHIATNGYRVPQFNFV